MPIFSRILSRGRRKTIVVKCGDDTIEVIVPADYSPGMPGQPTDADRGRGPGILAGPQPMPGVMFRAMAVIVRGNSEALEFDWTQFGPDVTFYELREINELSQDRWNNLKTENLDDRLRILNVTVTSDNETASIELERLHDIVRSDDMRIDAVRLFQLADNRSN